MNWIQLDRVHFILVHFYFDQVSESTDFLWIKIRMKKVLWNLIISEQSGKTHMSWDFFKLEIKAYRPTHVGNLRKKIFYLNNARKQTTEMSIHLIKTYSINKTSYFMIQICGRKIVTTAFVYLYIRGFYLYSIFTTHFKKVNAFLIELILKLCV